MEKNWWVSSCIIYINGMPFVDTNKEGCGEGNLAMLKRITVSQKVDAPDMFEFEIQIKKKERIVVIDMIREGAPVVIEMGQAGQEKVVFVGEINYIEPHFNADGTSGAIVRGYDKSHRLTRGSNFRTWGDGKSLTNLYPSVVQDVINKAGDMFGTSDGLQQSKVDSPQAKFSYIPQYGVNDYQFVKLMGQRTDQKLNNAGPQQAAMLNFYKLLVTESTGPAIKIVRDCPRGDNEYAAKSVRFNLSTTRQYSKVVIKSWDSLKKKAIIGMAKEAQYKFPGTPGWKATAKSLYGKEDGGKELVIVDRPVESKEEANALAQAIFNQLSMEFVKGDVTIKGTPDVKAGDIVELVDFGKRFSGKYLVKECVHTMSPKSMPFTTKLKIARNSIND